MGWSFYEILGFSLNKRQLFLVLLHSFVKIVNVKTLHSLRNVLGFKKFLIFSSFVIEEFIIVNNVSIFEFL
jgi:hypothetical protein